MIPLKFCGLFKVMLQAWPKTSVGIHIEKIWNTAHTKSLQRPPKLWPAFLKSQKSMPSISVRPAAWICSLPGETSDRGAHRYKQRGSLPDLFLVHQVSWGHGSIKRRMHFCGARAQTWQPLRDIESHTTLFFALRVTIPSQKMTRAKGAKKKKKSRSSLPQSLRLDPLEKKNTILWTQYWAKLFYVLLQQMSQHFQQWPVNVFLMLSHNCRCFLFCFFKAFLITGINQTCRQNCACLQFIEQ